MDAVLGNLLAQRDANINIDVPPLLHTYDYLTPGNAPAGPGLGPWSYEATNDLHGVPSREWNALAYRLIDRLADVWFTLAAKYSGSNVNKVHASFSSAMAVGIRPR